MAICKMGSKFVTLGSKVIFLGGNFFIFLSSKITFLAAKVGSRNYFFWAARIIFLSSKNSYFGQQIFQLQKFEILVYLEKRFLLKCMIFKIDQIFLFQMIENGDCFLQNYFKKIMKMKICKWISNISFKILQFEANQKNFKK